MLHNLIATPKTVHWGYFDANLTPALKVKSGDFVQMETVSQNAGDAPDLLMDEGIRRIYEEIPEDDRSPGVHIMTGPIWIEDAKPGDMLEVRYLQLTPRLLYGSNLAGSWGSLYDQFDGKERATIFKLVLASQHVYPLFGYDLPRKYDFPGMITQPHEAKREPALEGFRIPYRPHAGNAGVAPNEQGRVSSVPPGAHGGNMDHWKMGPGSVMYYPVAVDGALFSAGDAHFSQGDGEINGTAIECSMNMLIQVFVRKDFHLNSPLLETRDEWIVYGFDADLNQAMRKASLNMMDFLIEVRGLSKDDAYCLMSIAVDFTITQVVDQLKGVHAAIRKSVFPQYGVADK
jgi:acetamidase/formamidase